MADPAFPASLVDLPEPELPSGAWARVAVTAGGICGSDLHLFAHNTGPSPTLTSLGSFPFVLGHEIAGHVIESGPECSCPVGTQGGPRSVHTVPRPWNRSTVRELCPWVDVLVPQARQQDREQRTLARVHHEPRRRLGRAGARPPVDAAPDPRRGAGQDRLSPRTGLDCVSWPAARPSRGRGPGARGRRRNHRAGLGGGGEGAVPGLPGDGARPARPPGRGGVDLCGADTS